MDADDISALQDWNNNEFMEKILKDICGSWAALSTSGQNWKTSRIGCWHRHFYSHAAFHPAIFFVPTVCEK